MTNGDLTEQSLSYLKSLSIGYQQSRASLGLYQFQSPNTVFASGRPTVENLPQIVQDVYKKVLADYPDRGVELLKYRHTVGDKLITDIDDQTPLPSEDQLVVMNVTTSIVVEGKIEVTVYMLIGAWQKPSSVDNSTLPIM